MQVVLSPPDRQSLRRGVVVTCAQWDLERHLKELSSCDVMQEEFLYNLLFLIWFLVVPILALSTKHIQCVFFTSDEQNMSS